MAASDRTCSCRPPHEESSSWSESNAPSLEAAASPSESTDSVARPLLQVAEPCSTPRHTPHRLFTPELASSVSAQPTLPLPKTYAGCTLGLWQFQENHGICYLNETNTCSSRMTLFSVARTIANCYALLHLPSLHIMLSEIGALKLKCTPSEATTCSHPTRRAAP